MTLSARRRWTALIVICLADLAVTIDNTIVIVALPTISRELEAGTSGLQWVVDAYTLVFAGLLLAAGHLGDRFGRRRALVVGLTGFGVVSALAARSDSLTELITARAVMGVFAALVFPATLALLTNIFTAPGERVAAVSIWSAVSGVAVALGPVVGGYLLEQFSWSAVFWVNVPGAAAMVLLTMFLVPESRAAHVGRLDVAGVVLSIGAITALVWTIIEGPSYGWRSATIVGGAVTAVVLAGAFVWREVACSDPILDISLFRNARFSAASVAISASFFGLFGFIFLITQYFQAIRGYSTLGAGVRTLPFAVVTALVSPAAVHLAQKLGSGVVVALGLATMAGGFAVAATTGLTSAYWGPVIVAMVLMALGLALVMGPATEAIMGALPREQAGAGSAVNDTTREVGGTLGVAVMGSLLAGVFSGRVHSILVEAGVGDKAADTGRSSLVAGLRVARSVPGPAGTRAAEAIEHAFLAGLHHASWVAAGVTAVMAVLVLFALPNRASAAEVLAPRELAEA